MKIDDRKNIVWCDTFEGPMFPFIYIECNFVMICRRSTIILTHTSVSISLSCLVLHQLLAIQKTYCWFGCWKERKGKYNSSWLTICFNRLSPIQNSYNFTDDIFKCIILEWKCLNLSQNFNECCSQGYNWYYSSIISDNGLAPNRRQAII